MKNTTKWKAIGFAAAGLLAAGCSSQAPSTTATNTDFIPPDSAPRDMTPLLYNQQANGAASDGTLYPCHFDGAYLNSLGVAKLDMILADPRHDTLKVWLAVGNDDLSEPRRMAVGMYLHDHGVPLTQIQFGDGPNPQTLHSAAKGLTDLPKTDSTESDSSSSSASGSTPVSTSTGSAPPTGGPVGGAGETSSSQ
jgi:hypothetical protein